MSAPAAPPLPPRDELVLLVVDALAASLPIDRPVDPHELDAAAEAVVAAILPAVAEAVAIGDHVRLLARSQSAC